MDEYDMKILDFLQIDAKLTAKELASKLPLSQTPIYERIKKLEKSGAIKGYVAILNANVVNKNLIVFMNITIKEHGNIKRNKFIEDISKLKDVSEFDINPSITPFGTMEDLRKDVVDVFNEVMKQKRLPVFS